MVPVVAGIVNGKGRVFTRDSFGVCSVQLCGYPSIIRVRPLRQGIAHQLKLRNCNELNPTDVLLDIGEFDTIQHFFHGAIRIADSEEDKFPEFEQVKLRKMKPMIM
jgi:hypothetical protein